MSSVHSMTADLRDFCGVSRRVADIPAIVECVRDIGLPRTAPGASLHPGPRSPPAYGPFPAPRRTHPPAPRLVARSHRAPRTARELGIARAVRCNRGMTYDMRSVDDQLARVLDPVRPLPAIDVGLQDARGCILAEDVSAPWPLPPFDNAAMDGYAVLTGSVVAASPSMPVRLSVIEDIPAGSRPTSTVAAGTAARIMTGAPMPRGADAVVPVEDTDGQMPVVTIYQPTSVGRHVRRAGDDIPSGEIVLKAGTVMEARQTALAAAVGRGRVRVHPRPQGCGDQHG